MKLFKVTFELKNVTSDLKIVDNDVIWVLKASSKDTVKQTLGPTEGIAVTIAEISDFPTDCKFNYKELK